MSARAIPAPTTFLYEQRHRRHDRRRDDEGFEDAQRDAGGQATPGPRTRKDNGGQQSDEGQVLEAQQAHADREGRLDDVHREEEPGCCPEKLGDGKARGQEVHRGHGSARVRRHRRESRERPVGGSSDAPLADARRPPATLCESHHDEEQEDRADCAAHLRLRAHRQQERPEPHAGQNRRHEASQDLRICVSPVRPQGDCVADEEQGKHDAR